MSVSVVIPTKNRAKLLGLCLRSLVSQTKKVKEVVVVDNGSTDKTKKVVLNFKGKLPLNYVFEPRSGVSLARNCGIKRTTGNTIAFLDDDCQPKKDWIEQILKACQGEVYVLQGKSLNGLPGNFFSLLAYFFVEKNLRLQVLKARWTFKRTSKLTPISGFFDTKNATVRKSALDKLNYFFDENLKISGEDVDLGIRLRKAGFKIFFNPRMVVTHYGDDKLGPFLKGRFNRGRGFFLLERKWQKELEKVRKLRRYFKGGDRFINNRVQQVAKRVEKKLRREIFNKKKVGFKILFSFALILAKLVWQIGFCYEKCYYDCLTENPSTLRRDEC